MLWSDHEQASGRAGGPVSRELELSRDEKLTYEKRGGGKKKMEKHVSDPLSSGNNLFETVA